MFIFLPVPQGCCFKNLHRDRFKMSLILVQCSTRMSIQICILRMPSFVIPRIYLCKLKMGTLFYVCRKAEKIDTHLKTFFDIAQEMEPPQSRSIDEETGLVFDPRQYLASTRVRTYLFLVCKLYRHVSKTHI